MWDGWSGAKVRLIGYHIGRFLPIPSIPFLLCNINKLTIKEIFNSKEQNLDFI